MKKLLLVGLMLTCLGVFAEDKTSKAILTFDKPFLVSYKAWKDKAVAKNSIATIKADTGQGGAIYNFNDGLDLQAFKEMKPVLCLKIGATNQAKLIKILFKDAKGQKGYYHFSLAGQPINKSLRLLPVNSPNLNKPSVGNIDLATIKQIQIIGDWSSLPIDVKIKKLAVGK